MKTKKTCLRFRRLGFVLAAVTLGISARVTVADASKISGAIEYHRQIKERPPGVDLAAHRDAVRAQDLNGDDLEREEIAIYCDTRLTGADLIINSALGIEIDPTIWVPPIPGQHPLGFHVARARYEMIEFLAVDPRVRRVASIERRSRPLNDVSGDVTRWDILHNANVQGTGVVMAVADSGLDVTHPDVPTPISTTDVTDDDCDGCVLGTNVQNLVTNHGTHVTGTALGRGTSSDNNQYVGAAPGASLIFYKIGNDSTSSASTANMIQALTLAVAAGADIFTMSYGGLADFNDGSDPMEQAIDNAVAAGVAVFIAAGNEANLQEHYMQSVGPGGTSTTVAVADTCGGDVVFQLNWRDNDPSANNITLSSSQGTLTPIDSAISPRGTKHRTYSLTGQPANFTLTLQNNGQPTSSTPLVHVYSSSCSGAGAKPTFPSDASSSYTVGSPAVADGAIAVAATVHRTSWTSCSDDDWVLPGETLGATASFSSRGPRIDGALKPDVAAPGALMISLLDSNWQSFTGNNAIGVPFRIPGSDDNCVYAGNTGTSMACPAAAGIGAMILEAYPYFTPLQLRQRMYEAGENSTPDFERGYGIVRADDAVLTPASAVWVAFPYMGTEDGTYLQPWNTLAEALADPKIAGGGEINIRPHPSSETPTINQPVTLYAAYGPVTIGR